jgi:hypothetical protein
MRRVTKHINRERCASLRSAHPISLPHQPEKAFRRPANRTIPAIGNIFPTGARRDAAVGIALGFVVNVLAFQTVILSKIRHDSPHI